MIKNNIFIVNLLMIPYFLIGQNCTNANNTGLLDGNDVKAVFKSSGSFFDEQVATGFDVQDPTTGNTLPTIWAGGLWLGGYHNDSTRTLRLAIQTYNNCGNDYFSGPIVNGSASMCTAFDKVWGVKGVDVKALIQDYADNNIIDDPVATSLLAWPGRGNPHFFNQNGFSLPNQDLAPFRDRNSDGIYNPMDGDYPIADEQYLDVIADDLLWLVYNDIGNLHTESLGQPIGAEVQLTAYAFDCDLDPILGQTIFVKQRIINKSNFDIVDFKAALWTDFDIGCGEDDYFGTIPSQNTIYAYNSDSVDNDSCSYGVGSYVSSPPVQALTFLNQTITNSMYYFPRANFCDPVSPLSTYNLMDSKFRNSTPLTYGGDGYAPGNLAAVPTSFIFSSNPNDTAGWSMYVDTLREYEARNLMTTTKDTLKAGEQFDLVAAYSYHRDLDSNHLQNVNLMYSQIPIIQQYYNNGYDNNFCSKTVNISTVEDRTILVELGPNPTTGIIQVKSNEVVESIQIFNTLGHLVWDGNEINQAITQIDLSTLSNGIYWIYGRTAEGEFVEKVQLQK